MKQLKVFEWQMRDGRKNFGDLISKKIIEGVTNSNVVISTADEAEIVAVGSVIDGMESWFPKAKIIWGSGFLHDGSTVDNTDIKIAAVRGKLTANRLNFEGPLGDPGLLVNKYFEKSEKKFKIGIIPHYADQNNAFWNQFSGEDVLVIDVHREPEAVIKDITSVELVISSSLHGLIVADSFGIPNYWVALHNSVGRYKFKDYFSAVNREVNEVEILDTWKINDEEIQSLILNWNKVADLDKIQHELKNALLQAVEQSEFCRDNFTVYADVTDLSGLRILPETKEIHLFTLNRSLSSSIEQIEEFNELINTNKFVKTKIGKGKIIYSRKQNVLTRSAWKVYGEVLSIKQKLVGLAMGLGYRIRYSNN